MVLEAGVGHLDAAGWGVGVHDADISPAGIATTLRDPPETAAFQRFPLGALTIGPVNVSAVDTKPRD